MKLLTERPNSNFMLLVESENNGIESVHTRIDFVWILGILKTSYVMFEHMYRIAMTNEHVRRQDEEARMKMEASLNHEPGKVH